MIKAEYQENIWDEDEKEYQDVLMFHNDEMHISFNVKGFKKKELIQAVVRGIEELNEYETL